MGADDGIDPLRFVTDLFANRVSSVFVLDVIVQGRRAGIGARWLPLAATVPAGRVSA